VFIRVGQHLQCSEESEMLKEKLNGHPSHPLDLAPTAVEYSPAKMHMRVHVLVHVRSRVWYLCVGVCVSESVVECVDMCVCVCVCIGVCV